MSVTPQKALLEVILVGLSVWPLSSRTPSLGFFDSLGPTTPDVLRIPSRHVSNRDRYFKALYINHGDAEAVDA